MRSITAVNGHVGFDSAREMLAYLQKHDLYNLETGDFAWVYNESGSIAIDNLNKEQILRIIEEREPGESWSGYLRGGAIIWDDASYDGCDVSEGCTNLDYCEKNYMKYWVDCKVYEAYLVVMNL